MTNQLALPDVAVALIEACSTPSHLTTSIIPELWPIWKRCFPKAETVKLRDARKLKLIIMNTSEKFHMPEEEVMKLLEQAHIVNAALLRNPDVSLTRAYIGLSMTDNRLLIQK